MENSTNIVNDIKKIVEENQVQVIKIGDRTFTTKDLYEVKPIKNTANKIVFNDLSSIATIVKRESGKFFAPLYIFIEDEKTVSVLTSLDDEKDREAPYVAKADDDRFRFGREYDYESFVIAIRSLFVQNNDTTELLNTLKKVSTVESVETEDDGVTQKVVAKAGSSLAESLKVAPIRKLAPYRTFIEVEQPESEFLFRLFRNNQFALFEADGGAWKIKAKAHIRAYFEKALKAEIDSGVVVVLG